MKSKWVYILLGMIIGILFGSWVTRCHYKEIYKDYVKPKPCGSINYYDMTGKVLLYKDTHCTD